MTVAGLAAAGRAYTCVETSKHDCVWDSQDSSRTRQSVMGNYVGEGEQWEGVLAAGIGISAVG